MIIDVFGEWDAYQDLLLKNKISVIKLNLDNYFKKINGYFVSRYYQIKIFILAFFPLLNLFKKKKTRYCHFAPSNIIATFFKFYF